jgi:hypothetical protein
MCLINLSMTLKSNQIQRLVLTIATLDRAKETIFSLENLKFQAYQSKPLQLGQELGLSKDILDDLDFIVADTGNTFKNLLQEIISQLKKVTVVEITTAQEFSLDFYKEICKKFYAGFNEYVFVDFKTDLNILGGCRLSYKGVYRDYSVRRSLEQLCLTN